MDTYIKKLNDFLLKHKRYYKKTLFINQLSIGFIIFFSIITLLNLIFSIVPLTLIPFLWDITLIFFLIFIFASYIKYLFKKISLKQIAQLLEGKINDKHQLLTIAVDIYNDNSNTSLELKRLIIKNAISSIRRYPNKLIVPVNWLRLTIVAGIILIWMITSFYVKPQLIHYWLLPYYTIKKTDGHIIPGTTAQPLGSKIKLSLLTKNKKYLCSQLYIKTIKSNSFKKQNIKLDENTSFSYIIDSLVDTTIYSFKIGNNYFGPETIYVIYPPILKSLQIEIIPPAYTGLKSKTFLNTYKGIFSAIEGSKIKINITSNNTLRHANLISTNKKIIDLKISKNRAFGTTNIWKTGECILSLTDTFNQTNDSIHMFLINSFKDNKPYVTIIKPGKNQELSTSLIETLWIEGIDDFGIKQMNLFYKKNLKDLTNSKQTLFFSNKNQKILKNEFVWNLNNLHLYPNDTVFYWAEITDNKLLLNPQKSFSDTFWFRLPTFKEIHEKILKNQTTTRENLLNIKKSQTKILKELENFSFNNDEKNKTTKEEINNFNSLNKEVKKEIDSLKTAIKSLDKTIQEMKNNGFLNDALLSKIKDIQKSIKNLINQYGDSILFDSSQNNNNITYKDMKHAVQKMKDALPNLEEQLNNILSYLENIRKDQKLFELSVKAKNLAKKQLGLTNDKMLNKLEKQKNLLDEISDLMNQTENLNLPNKNNLFNMINSLHKKMFSEIDKNKYSKKSNMINMSAYLQSLSQEFLDMQSSSLINQIINDKKILLELTNKILHIADWQKEIYKFIKQKEELREIIRQELELKYSFINSMKDLDSALSIPPQIINNIFITVKETNNSIDKYLKHPNNRHFVIYKKTLTNLNKLANQLILTRKKLGDINKQQNGSNNGMLSGLKKISGKQAMINSMTQSMLQQMLSHKKTSKANLASAQKEIITKLDKLEKEYKNKQNINKIKQLKQDAEKLTDMLKNNNKNIINYQNQFLVRLLQTTSSFNKQNEQKEKRKSVSYNGIQNYSTNSPQKRVLFDVDTFFKTRIKAVNENYPIQYKSKIQQYFDSLSVKFLGK